MKIHTKLQLIEKFHLTARCQPVVYNMLLETHPGKFPADFKSNRFLIDKRSNKGSLSIAIYEQKFPISRNFLQ